MSKLRLTFACGPYDRTLALRDGSIQPEGIELNYIASQPPDIFWRMLQFNEFEISEMSLSNHATGFTPFIAASGRSLNTGLLSKNTSSLSLIPYASGLVLSTRT